MKCMVVPFGSARLYGAPGRPIARPWLRRGAPTSNRSRVPPPRCRARAPED